MEKAKKEKDLKKYKSKHFCHFLYIEEISVICANIDYINIFLRALPSRSYLHIFVIFKLFVTARLALGNFSNF